MDHKRETRSFEKTEALLQRMFDQAEAWKAAADNRYVFLQCYAMMSHNMLQAMRAGEFLDPRWVNRLLHRFAGYYFEALAGYDCGECRSRVWRHAHEHTCRRRLLAVQYLLLGVNAHINYDLVLSLVDVLAPEWDGLSAAQREARYRDHQHVNAVIAATIDAVQDEVIEAHTPWMDILDRLLLRTDEWLISRLITRWRDEVWSQARRFLETDAPARRRELQRALEARVIERAERLLLR